MLSSGREETSRLPAAGCLSSHPGLKSAFSFGRAGPVARRSPPFHRPGKPRGGTGRTLSVPARGGMRGGRPHPLLPLGRKHPRTARGAAAARMAAKARSGARVCFIGSCAAKKPETSRSSLPSDRDCVLPFGELQGMFDAPGGKPLRRGAGPEGVSPPTAPRAGDSPRAAARPPLPNAWMRWRLAEGFPSGMETVCGVPKDAGPGQGQKG